MAKPSSLSEAIERLETVGTSKAHDLKEILEKDYHQLQKALEEIKPHLEGLKDQIQAEARKKKNEVETQVKENPWMALGIVGLFALIIGILLGNSRK